MRTLAIIICVLATFQARAAEPWLLPCEADPATQVLLHLDADTSQQPNAGTLDVDAMLVKDAPVIDGVFGSAVGLDGHGQCVRLPSTEDLRLGVDEPFTIECWIRPDSADGTIFSVGINYYLNAHFSRGTASLGYRAESFPIRWYTMTGIPWQRRQWQHVALTHDENRVVRLYLDGHLVAETQHGDEGTYTEKPGGATFGSHDGWRSHLAGAIDEIRISRTIRDFQPLLTQRIYLEDEQVRLNLTDVTLPDHMESIQVTVTSASGEEIAQRELSVAEAAHPADQAIVPAADLGEGAATVQVTFVDGDGGQLAQHRILVSYGGAAVAALQERLAAAQRALVGCPEELPERKIVDTHLRAVREAIARRDLDAADAYMSAAEGRLRMVATGEAAYRARLREHVRALRHEDVRITMSWDADDAASAFPWAERIGANELVSPHRSADREGLRAWKDAGYQTAMLSNAPMHTADPDRPDHSQFGYWYMDTPPAEGGVARVKLESVSWGGMSLTDHFDPAEHWWVFDRQTGERLPGDRYSFDLPSRTVTITGAPDGRVFRVYYLMAASRIGDPLYEPFAEHGLEVLRGEIAPLEGVLDTFWNDDLAYVWPGRTPQGAYDWESYFAAARPETQRLFTEQTGIEFDPRWLVLAPRTLDEPPPIEYIAWMHWVQERVKAWMRRATDVIHEHGARAWLYWGDAHVGIEPYMNSIEAGGVDEIDKPSGDAVTARALVDFPGDAYRRLRVDWLYTHLVGRADGSDTLRIKWGRSRRGLLMQPAEGIYWMPMPAATGLSDDSIREDLVETIAQIDDEFRLIAGELGRVRAWEGALNLYVAHAWGAQYSWRPWNDAVLTHLTDLPVRVRFINFREIIDAGVPTDAHCLFLYGMPGTAWSGGPAWGDTRLATAVEQFVYAGGGLVGLQGPSALDDGWALADTFGVDGTGAVAEAEIAADYSGDAPVPDEALVAAREAGGPSLARVAEVPGIEMPPSIASMGETVGAVPVRDNVTVACVLVDEGETSPGVTLREFGEGRA
ncbi:MAG: 1,3-beta-galactosyl-N-acetylhexosamine phosphorylase N-terminal domain-containing protein, partial [Armatimonadota bacterium]